MMQHRNIGHDWQFGPEQQDLLSQYYDANKLLVDCLNSNCYMSREVRQEIEAGLLLPRQGEGDRFLKFLNSPPLFYSRGHSTQSPI